MTVVGLCVGLSRNFWWHFVFCLLTNFSAVLLLNSKLINWSNELVEKVTLDINMNINILVLQCKVGTLSLQYTSTNFQWWVCTDYCFLPRLFLARGQHLIASTEFQYQLPVPGQYWKANTNYRCHTWLIPVLAYQIRASICQYWRCTRPVVNFRLG